MVEDGLWRSQPSASRTRQRTEFYAVEVHAVAEDRPGCRATKTTDPASSLGATESEGT
jgi:hypothetical protein